MGFIMEGLDAEDYDRTYRDRALLRRILGYFRPKLGLMASSRVASWRSSLTRLRSRC